MNIEPLPLPALFVNPGNDRHGELLTEQNAMSWLLENRRQHMKKLAADIVSQRGIYEPPLVAKTSKSNYLVHDGNRRVTCLKLLFDPSAAPSEEVQAYFTKLRSKWQGDFSGIIDCQIETDPERIDEILYRRHTGAQSGIGQSAWDDSAKHNFIARTGRFARNLAEQIEKKLISAELVKKEGVIPRSNLNRLLSSEEFRNAIGISQTNGDLVFISDPDKVLEALDRVAHDLIQKRLVLGHIWNNEGKRQYFAELRDQGVLPRPEDELRIPLSFSEEIAPKRNRPTKSTHIEVAPPRQTLIATDVSYDLTWTQATVRIRDIWHELQQLNIERFPNAVACSFRVLLELSTDHCISSSYQTGARETDALSRKLSQTALYLETKGALSEKYRKEIQRFAHSEELLSASAMHRYIHSTTYSPSPRHLSAIWDTLSEFIDCCLNQVKTGQRAA